MAVNPTSTHIDLAGVIAQAQNLDPTALGQLFDLYYPQIYGYIAFRLGEGTAAGEISTQVFEHLLETNQRYPKSTGDIKTWLFTTAEAFVEEKLGQMIGEDKQHNAAHSGEPDQAAGEAVWLGRLVRASLRRLMLEQQHLLALRFGCAFSLDETARIMSRNVSEVKSLQMEALLSVRALMEEES